MKINIKVSTPYVGSTYEDYIEIDEAPEIVYFY